MGSGTVKVDKDKAAVAAQTAAAGVIDLLNIVRFGDGKSPDAPGAEAHLLKAARLGMEISGFDPDEAERGALYRTLVDYIATLGED
jgi:hypothetical protein